MSKKTTWGEVEKGDVVDLEGRAWRVRKIKKGKKSAAVRVEFKGRTAEADVPLGRRVKIVTRAADVDPVQDASGAQRRWAKPKELAAALAPGDPARTRPPTKPAGEKWDKKHPKGTAEGRLEKVLGAKLIAETKVEAAGYLVPPVDVSTVAAHLALMHAFSPAELDEAGMIRVHDAQHAEAKSRGAALAVNHWHSERRP